MKLTNRKIYLILITFILLIILFMPIHKMNIKLCLYKKTFHIPCPLCGMLHSLHHSGNGKFLTAFSYHPLGPVLFSFLILLVPFLLIEKLYIKMINFVTSFKKPIIFFTLILFIFSCIFRYFN